jgi:hypothetical protein
MEKLQEEIQLLKTRISYLEVQILNRTRLEKRSASFLVGMFRPIRLDFIKEFLNTIPNPLSLRDRLNESFVNNPKTRFDNFHIEFLKDISALEIRKMIKQQKIEVEIDFDARYIAVDVRTLMDRQSAIMAEVITEQKERIREELNTKYQIGGKFRGGNLNYKNF